MDARLTSLLFATAFCSASASAQSLDARFHENGPAAVQQKLGTDGVLIETVYGSGYRYRAV